MRLHRIALNLSLLAGLLSGAGLCQAQQRELREVKPEPKAVLRAAPAASGMQVHTPQGSPADCRPPQNAAECSDRINKAHDLLESIGRECESCAPVAAASSQPQTSTGKGVRVRVELPHFCQGVMAVARQKGYTVSCKKR